MPDMSSSINRAAPYEKFSSKFYSEVVSKIPKDKFKTAIGKPGDIYLLHPLMVHSAQPNYLRGQSSSFHPCFTLSPSLSLISPNISDIEACS